jgi:cytidylate kinase
VDTEDDGALSEFLKTLDILFDGNVAKITVNGEDLSEKIRTPEAGVAASKTSSKSVVRRFLVALQQEMAKGGSVVMEGRDIGTVVLTDADYKFFLTASHEVRAARRHKEFQGKTGSGPAASEVSKQIAERDERDTKRLDSPLKAADDAQVIDTGELDIEGVINSMLSVIDVARGA